MKALVKTGPGAGELALMEVADPHAGPGRVVMRVGAASICGTDVHIAHGTYAVATPRILGHELAGTVAEVGPGVVGIQPGQPITTETDASFCGRCRFCLAGDMQLCSDRTGIGTSADGGFAEYVVLPARGVHLLPPGLAIAAGALTEPVAVAVHAVAERAAVAEGERLAVIGPGTIGLLAAQVGRAVGADVVLVGLERHAARFGIAADLGIASSLVVDGPPGEAAVDEAAGTFDVVVDCSGSDSAVRTGLRLLRKGGRLVLVGFHGAPLRLDVDAVIDREQSLIASRGKRPASFRLALELLGARRVDTASLITHEFPLSEWAAAFDAADHHGTKVILRM